jgi:hypothetical protein
MTPLRYLFLAGFVALVASTALLMWNPSALAFVIQLFALVTIAGAFFLHGSEDKLNLTSEWIQTFQDLQLQMHGIKDHVSTQNLRIDQLQHEVAVLDAKGGADEVEKMKDRIALIEVNSGMSNRFTSTNVQPLVEYRPAAKKRDA